MTFDVDPTNSAVISSVAGVDNAGNDGGDDGADIGFVPIFLPHKNRARYVVISNEMDRRCDPALPIYQIIESSHGTLLGGVLAYTPIVPFLPVVFGGGIVGQFSKNFDSIRSVSGKQAAYLAPELCPPKTIHEVLAWPDDYTSITYHRLRGFKLVLGVYAIAHGGATFEMEGIWTHRVIKHNNEITVSLLLKSQKRLKGTLGVAPVIANNADLFHTALSKEVVFKFTDIDKDFRIKKVLAELLDGHSQSAIINAKLLAEEYESLNNAAPITFSTEQFRSEKESRHRFRIRLPLLSNYQKVIKKRDREQQTTFHYEGACYQSKQLISEVIHRIENQMPIDFIKWNKDAQLYPNRMQFNFSSGINWPIDYRNKTLERSTQVIKNQKGSAGFIYDNDSVRYLWQLSDNYLSKAKFLKILADIGIETGLKPLLFSAFDVPEFVGPDHLKNDQHESVFLSMHISIRDYEKTNVYQKVLNESFIENTLTLFDEYFKNPKGDYLHLGELYKNENDFYRLYREGLKEKCLEVVNKTHRIQCLFKNNKKPILFGLRSKELTQIDKMHSERKLWEMYRQDPFIFLMVFEGSSPKCKIQISGSSMNLERHIELSLAREIMRSKGTVPIKYLKNTLQEEPGLDKSIRVPTTFLNKQRVSLNFDSCQYYGGGFIDYVQKNNIKKIMVVVSSWSDGALQFPRSAHIGSRQSRDLPHHLIMAQKLKKLGIYLKIYYLAFDNTLHFNQKDKRAVDTTMLSAYEKYLLHFDGEDLDSEQLKTIYLNPQYIEKEGDVIIKELAPVVGLKGNCLSFSGKNALEMKALKQKISVHDSNGDLILGMTAHSSGHEMQKLSEYLDLQIIGSNEVGLKYGTKEGNKILFEKANVPYVYGTHIAIKDIDELIRYGFLVALRTRCKRLMIKHNSSSAGKGNLVIDVSSSYQNDGVTCSYKKFKQLILSALNRYRHPEKDIDIKEGCETFYMRKIRELGAIVEEMVDAKKIVSPGSLAVVKSDGSVDVEYIYDQILTGNDGQNFGGSLGPSELEQNDIVQMTTLTKTIGEALYNEGFHGYYGLDFLKCDDKPLIVIEANIRKTGTRYPFMFVSHLFNEHTLKQKHFLHDDNIKLPVDIKDLTGRNLAMNHYISSLYYWLMRQPITFCKEKGTGTIVSFDTHSSGKLGVLSIGNTRIQAIELSKQFQHELLNFSQTFYLTLKLPEQYYGLNQSYYKTLADNQSVNVFEKTMQEGGLVNGSCIVKAPSFTGMNKLSNKVHRITNQLPKKVLRYFSEHSFSKSSHKPLIKPLKSISTLNKSKEELLPLNELALVFALVGRTRTSDYLLVEAMKKGIDCYRMTEDSKVTYDKQTGKGYITHVYAATISSKTGKPSIGFDDYNQYPLPTIVYNYDFSSARRLFHQDRGSKIFFDNSQTLWATLHLIKPALFNDINKQWQYLELVSPLRSQLAFAQMLSKFSPALFARYPKSLSLLESKDSNATIMSFINENDSFYIKRALAAHDPHNHQTQIYAFKKDGDIIFEYFLEMEEDNTKVIKPQFIKLPFSKFQLSTFLSLINEIKHQMHVAENVQFILQEDLSQVIIKDMSQRSLRAKLRVVTLHDPNQSKLISTSFYGVYGGKNAYLGYVGDPRLYLQAAKGMQYLDEQDAHQTERLIRNIAVECHATLEKSMGSRLGEVVTDFMIGSKGIVPLKANIKPERLNLDFINQQTHYGHYLEGNEGARHDFLTKLAQQESIRSALIIDNIVHLNAKRHDSLLPVLSHDEDNFDDFNCKAL